MNFKNIRSMIIILVIMVASPLFGNNLQKTYTVNDEIYRRVDILCREAGVIGPSSFSPVTGRVLQIALGRIDRAELSPELAAEYDELYQVITDKEILLDFESDFFAADLNINANLQFNIADYDKFIYANGKNIEPEYGHQNEVLIPYRYESPALSLDPELYFGDILFLEADFSIRNNPYRLYESSFGWLLTGVTGSPVFFGEGTNSSLAPELPYKAGLSLGNEYISFILGRYPHSLGSGITGNMLVGDNFTFQEVMNLSFISNYFTYNISLTRFDQQIVPDPSNPYLTNFSRSEFGGDQQFRVVHRFDLNIINRIRFVLNLGTLYNSTNSFDFRFFYPFVINHNYFNYTNVIEESYFDEANNIISFELEFVPWKGITVGGQFVLDQAQMYFEDSDGIPAAYGGLGNIKYSTRLGGGSLNTWFEGVYTSPYLYLNGKRTGEQVNFNLDYVVGYHIQHLDSYGFSGYIHGPDTVAFALGGEYTSADNSWNVGLNLMYKATGEKGLKHSFETNQITNIDMSNAYIEEESSDFMNKSTPSGGWANAEHLVKLAAFGGYRFDEYNLELFGAFGINSYFNYNREKGVNVTLPQFSFGVKWTGLKAEWFR